GHGFAGKGGLQVGQGLDFGALLRGHGGLQSVVVINELRFSIATVQMIGINNSKSQLKLAI
ncbi:MAG: hypothetical protein ACREXR_23175, partial [Gammaproteobacteria bacterium]